LDLQIALILAQDAIVNGAIYALLAIALVLVFTVTRVIFVPQGDFVAYAALTLAALQLGRVPGTLWLLLAGAAWLLVVDLLAARRARSARAAVRTAIVCGALPALLGLATWKAAGANLPLAVQVLLSLALVIPLGPIMYRIVFRPIAHVSVLVLLIVSVAAHYVLQGLALVFFGAEGERSPPLSDATFTWGMLYVTGQALVVLATTIALIVAMFWFFSRSYYGKALRATASNRVGALLMGISPASAGSLAFTLAAAIGALSGVLIGSFTTMFYDTGFVIGLKGFVAAILAGLVSYPLAAAGALLVGFLEAYASFWASAFKEVIVFALIIPVLLWRSLRTHHVEEDE
jgi:branched-chain amino acid transport system permease protein